MAERILLKRAGDMLAPVDQHTIDFIRNLQSGNDYAADVVQLRNSIVHRKCFAYMKLAFEYWEPKNYLSQVERNTVGELGKFLTENGLNRDTVRALCISFMRRLDATRQGENLPKDFEAFREFVTVEAGYYRTVITPSGPRKEAMSWAFKNMSETKFQALFMAIRNVCWDLILSQKFASQDDADIAADRLLGFD